MTHVVLESGVVAELCLRYPIKEIAFFGSVTRADFRPDSDIDILIEFDAGAKVGLFELMAIQDTLTARFGRPVDLVTKSMLSPYFRDQVLASREVVYDRSQ